jgi:hypothetical protein
MAWSLPACYSLPSHASISKYHQYLQSRCIALKEETSRILPSSGIYVTLVWTDISGERIVSIIKGNRISELGIAVTSKWSTLRRNTNAGLVILLRVFQLQLLLTFFLARWLFCPGDGGDTFLRNVGSYKSHVRIIVWLYTSFRLVTGFIGHYHT